MSRPHVVAPSELSSLRDLELLARTTVEGLRQGLHRSPFHGFNAEFSQYRHYRPGDDLKYIDWKAFGRTDRLYSRQFRETTNLSALVAIDVSRSMAFPEGAASKFELARAVAAILTALVIDQGDAAGVLAVSGTDVGGSVYVPPRSGRHHLHVQLGALSRLECRGREPVATSLRRAATLLRRRGLVILITDFYDDESTLSEVRRLARLGHDVVNIHVLAREELTLSGASAVEFVDLETEDSLVASPQGVANEYRAAFNDFLGRTKHSIEREGMDYVRLVTGEPIEPVLRRFLVGRRGGE